MAATYTAATIVFGCLCVPRDGKSWVVVGISPKCGRVLIMVSYVLGPFNLVSDLYLLLMPLPAVWQLHLPLRKRIGIAGIFLTGLLAFIASVVGLYFRVQLVAAFRTITNKFQPFGSRRMLRDEGRLETGILGSMEGDGKFLTSSDLSRITISADGTEISNDGMLK
ncbi:MAG: hypothetical protein Q9221_004335 [Calogaya cf. arnoldii]